MSSSLHAVCLAAILSGHPAIRGAIGAVVIGAVGSAAYLTALLLGFLGDTALEQLRPRFEVVSGSPAVKKLSAARVALFILFGAAIAAVFQLAQGGVFAPVQALVLGATWPTVISQVLSKTGQTDADKIVALAKQIAGSTP